MESFIKVYTAVLPDEDEGGRETAVVHTTKAPNMMEKNNKVSFDGLPTGVLTAVLSLANQLTWCGENTDHNQQVVTNERAIRTK